MSVDLVTLFVGALCGAIVASAIHRDRERARRRPKSLPAERRELANKIALHLNLDVKGDVWTLTQRDFGVILDSLRAHEP